MQGMYLFCQASVNTKCHLIWHELMRLQSPQLDKQSSQARRHKTNELNYLQRKENTLVSTQDLFISLLIYFINVTSRSCTIEHNFPQTWRVYVLLFPLGLDLVSQVRFTPHLLTYSLWLSAAPKNVHTRHTSLLSLHGPPKTNREALLFQKEPGRMPYRQVAHRSSDEMVNQIATLQATTESLQYVCSVFQSFIPQRDCEIVGFVCPKN